MNFCPKELCEKLVELGCKAEWKILDVKCHGCGNEFGPSRYPEFLLEDFVAKTEQADKNFDCVIRHSLKDMGRLDDDTIETLVHKYRHQMIDADDCWVFLKESMG